MKEEQIAMRRGRPLLLFYLLVIYIFSSFIWWSYLLVEKNKMAFAAQVGKELMQYNLENHLPSDSQEYFNSIHYKDLNGKYQRQRWMIIGEGTVFLILLASGAYTIYGTFTREMLLARQQNNFLLSITHELKSPLASIKLSLQTLIKRVTMEEKFGKILNNSLLDVDRLEMLVDNILLAAKVESSGYNYNMDKTDLSSLMDALLERLKSNCNDHTLVFDIQEDVNATIDRLTFSSAIINLVENAIKYSPTDSVVTVSMQEKREEIEIAVSDEGIGIPDKEKPNVFNKFYRIGSEATRTSKGTGLGLFIVRKVVTDHGGRVSVLNNTPRGTIFKINIPADTNRVLEGQEH